jgi:hypothetical protein
MHPPCAHSCPLLRGNPALQRTFREIMFLQDMSHENIIKCGAPEMGG